MRYLTMALLVLWCGIQGRTITAQGGTADGLVGKVWVATDPSAAPGTLRIFLANGTLVMDSCGETYRLSEWKRIDDRHVEWTEDGVPIRAKITALTSDRVRLTLQLKTEAKDETYRLATVPTVCADLPRGDASQTVPATPPPRIAPDPYVEKQRIVVMTDIANEPDDQMSLVRFLVYATDYDVEGLIATTSTWMKHKVRPDVIRAVYEVEVEVHADTASGRPFVVATRTARA